MTCIPKMNVCLINDYQSLNELTGLFISNKITDEITFNLDRSGTYKNALNLSLAVNLKFKKRSFYHQPIKSNLNMFLTINPKKNLKSYDYIVETFDEKTIMELEICEFKLFSLALRKNYKKLDNFSYIKILKDSIESFLKTIIPVNIITIPYIPFQKIEYYAFGLDEIKKLNLNYFYLGQHQYIFKSSKDCYKYYQLRSYIIKDTTSPVPPEIVKLSEKYKESIDEVLKYFIFYFPKTSHYAKLMTDLQNKKAKLN